MLDDKLISDLKDKHGDISSIEFAGGIEAVFKKPPRQEYNRWYNKRDEDQSGSALILANACLVHPTYQELVQLLDKEPAMLMCKGGVIDAITDLAGVPGDSKKPKKL